METISNVAAAAQKAIFGESTNGHSSSAASNEHSSMVNEVADDSLPKHEGSSGGPPKIQNSSLPQSGAGNPNTSSTDDKPAMSSSGTGTDKGGIGSNPSVGADPASAQQPTQKQQGGDRPNEEPEDLSGPKRTDSGDSTNSDNSADSGAGGGGADAGKMGGMAGGMKLPDSESKEEGTGTKYEKSTGLSADGGDFDATRPGAGREADRLLEEKGIKRQAGGSISAPSGKGDLEHTGLRDKIKAKLGKS